MNVTTGACFTAVFMCAVMPVSSWGNESKPSVEPPWTSADASPVFAALTVRSGAVYTLVQAGSLEPSSGQKPVFAIFYVSDSREPSRLAVAATELFEAWRPLAERSRAESLVVIAYFDLEPGMPFGSAQSWVIGYNRDATGLWTKAPMKAAPPASGRVRPSSKHPRSDKKALAAARKMADRWLKLLDGDCVEDAWSDASSFFQGQIPRPRWAEEIADIRRAKGRVVKRLLLSSLERQQLPARPRGPYVALDFVSTFEKADGVVERVSMRLSEDGKWRVFGYSVY